MWMYSDQWAAGFFDGEGNVTVFRRQRGNCLEHRVIAQITQKDRRPLDAIREIFGGSIHLDTCSQCWKWRADGQNTERFLRAILPYSLVKRSQIVIVLKIRETIGHVGCRRTPEIRTLRERLYLEFRATV